MENVMKIIKRKGLFFGMAASALFLLCASASAQNAPSVMAEKDAAVVIPTSFYFAGQSAPTQMRNAAAAKLAKDRLVIAGLVDTSGYSTEISGKYEGFFITDSAVKIGDKELATGAYGFGFSQDGKLNIFDIGARQILSVNTQSDADMKRPRPLQMVATGGSLRLYKGKNYVAVSPK
jgi:hypothetical protein